MVDTAIKWINLYTMDNAAGFRNTYPLDSNLSGVLGYPMFELVKLQKALLATYSACLAFAIQDSFLPDDSDQKTTWLASKPSFQQNFSGANMLNKSMYYLNSYFQKSRGGNSNQKTLCWGVYMDIN